jgi:hypothetical protein
VTSAGAAMMWDCIVYLMGFLEFRNKREKKNDEAATGY